MLGNAQKELLGKRFYGSCPNIETVKNCLFGTNELTCPESVDESTKEWLGHFLCLKPEMRWTAQGALDYAMFTPIGYTTETADRFQQVAQGVLIKERRLTDREYKVSLQCVCFWCVIKADTLGDSKDAKQLKERRTN